jgi:signal transduction histidine kinase
MHPTSLRIFRIAYWLVRLRWFAIFGIVIAYYTAIHFLHISIWELPVYFAVLFVIVLNITSYSFLKYLQRSNVRKSRRKVNLIINFQISTDLIALTFLLHYSGGVENPFIVYYIFHMIIGSIILSNIESILQTSFALILVGAMVILEYTGILKHYPLEGFIITNMYNNLTYLVFTGLIFVSTSYFILYLTKTIILESRKHEKAYLEANQKLKQEGKIKNEYVMRITHDIKGHITAIQSCINILHNKISGPLNPQQEDFVNRAHLRIGILNKFISDLLSLTQRKLQQKQNRKNFNLKHTIEEAMKVAENYASGKNVSLMKQMDSSISDIYGEQASIEEVLINLLINAIKYSPAGKNVTITAKDQEEMVLIEVIDNGVGIPEDETELIFNEFYRASNARSQTIEGSGLGLTITKHIIENHGGKIWVKSKLDEGTTFSLLLKKGK